MSANSKHHSFSSFEMIVHPISTVLVALFLIKLYAVDTGIYDLINSVLKQYVNTQLRFIVLFFFTQIIFWLTVAQAVIMKIVFYKIVGLVYGMDPLDYADEIAMYSENFQYETNIITFEKSQFDEKYKKLFENIKSTDLYHISE